MQGQDLPPSAPFGGEEEAGASVTHGNVFAGLSPQIAELPEQVRVLTRGKNCRVESIVSWGHKSPPDFWYDQSEDELVLVLSGAATLTLEGEPSRSLGPGDWVNVPARVKHRVEWTDPARPTVWLAVFFER